MISDFLLCTLSNRREIETFRFYKSFLGRLYIYTAFPDVMRATIVETIIAVEHYLNVLLRLENGTTDWRG